MANNKVRIANIFVVLYTEGLKKAKELREELAKEINEKTNGLVELETIFVEHGLASIEGYFDEAINTPFILKKVKWAAENGFDVITIDCFGDPGLDAARELVDVPVLGANETSIHIASILGKRFSIINILPETEGLIRDLIRKYGLESNLASIRTIHIPVLELEKDVGSTLQRAYEVAEKMVKEDRAYVIVLGCTGMAGLGKKIEEYLHKKGYKVPVIDPLEVMIYTAISIGLMNKKHSREAFGKPRKKPKKVPDIFSTLF